MTGSAEIAECKQRAVKTLSIVALAAGSELLCVITYTETPSDAWLKLQRRLKRNTTANELFLRSNTFDQ